VIGKKLVFLHLLAAILFVRPLRADNVPDPTAAALFRKGRELVENGDWDKGCEQFRASLARYEAASTLLNIARCEEHFGRVAKAWALYQRGLVLARSEPGTERREGLEKVARDGISAMEPRLPKLLIEIASPPPGLEVHESSRPIPVGEAVPLDPGPHDLVARAPGFATLNKRVELEEGKTTTVALVLRAEEAKPVPVAPPREKAKPPAPKPAPEVLPERGGVPTWAWVSGGAGVVLLSVATVFALDAAAQRNKLVDHCGSDFDCSEEPTFDPGPTNARKNRSLGLAIGLGSAGLIAIGASISGIAGARTNVAISPRNVWLSADFAL
jgi:hypothetical protein